MGTTLTALITGCSKGGIGSALALELASRGYHVLATVRNASKAAHFAGVSNIEVLTLDVTSAEAIEQTRQRVLAQSGGGGKLDLLINNAGGLCTGPLLDVDLARAKRLFDVNLWGMFAVNQALAPLVVAARGTIVNVSSCGALVCMPFGGLYHASKAAVTSYSETLRLELAPLGVAVVTAMLGTISTNVHANDAWQPLAPDSYYKPIEASVLKAAEGDFGIVGEPVDEFAGRFIGDILGGRSGLVWRGTKAQTVRFIMGHFPSSLVDSMIVPGSGLNELAKINNDNKK